MNSKLLLLVLGLLALGCATEAKDFLKKRSHKKLAFAPTTAEKALGHMRRRRDADPTTATTTTATTNPTSSEEITSEELQILGKFFITVAWQDNKLELLSDFIDDLSDHDTNLTLVGWQRVLDDEGHDKEINIVELAIPPKPEGVDNKDDVDFNFEDDDDDDDDEDEDDDRAIPYHQVNELREILNPLAMMGIPASITMEENNRHGFEEGLIYIDKDELYVKYEGFAIYNKTSTASHEYVDEFIKKQPESIFGEPAVLRYDVDGKLDLEKSHIAPVYLGGVTDYYEAPDNILLKSPQYIAQISQQYPHEDIPHQLAVTYNKEFPEYTWRVLVDPEHYFVTRDVSVTLTYDNFDLDEASDIEYLVYGVKKDVAEH